MKRVIGLLLALLIVFTLYACKDNSTAGPASNADTGSSSTAGSSPASGSSPSGSSTAGSPSGAQTSDAPAAQTKTGGTVNYPLGGEPTTISAWLVRNPIDTTVASFLYEYLMKYDANGIPQPYLLDSITGDNAALTYTLKIKDGVKFHDGSSMTADVVAWNINNYMENGVLSGSFYGSVDSAAATDPLTVVVKMNKWDSLFPYALARTCYIVSKDAFDKNGVDYFNENAVGTGPFFLENWDHGVGLSLAKFSDYWKGSPNLDGISLSIYNNPLVTQAALESGDLDVFPGITDFSIANSLKTNSKLTLATAPIPATAYTLCYNASDPDDPLNDLRVRQAISYAINTQAILDACLYGYGWVSSQWCLEGTPYYSNNVSGYSYNVDKAKDLLAQAGYPNGFDTRITLQVGSLEDGAQIIAQQLAAVGINVSLNIVEVANYAGYIGGWETGMLMHPMGATNGAASQMAANFVQGLNAGLGVVSFIHPDDLHNLINEALAADGAKSVDLFKQVADMIFEKYCMAKVIVITQSITVWRNDLKDAGFCESTSGAATWEKAWFDR